MLKRIDELPLSPVRWQEYNCCVLSNIADLVGELNSVLKMLSVINRERGYSLIRSLKRLVKKYKECLDQDEREFLVSTRVVPKSLIEHNFPVYYIGDMRVVSLDELNESGFYVVTKLYVKSIYGLPLK